jgi:formylmethanofuran dehydrogenase subunit E
MEVTIKVAPEDMPGRPMRRVQCDSCGEHIQDMREVYQDGKILCVPCAGGGYYTSANSTFKIQNSNCAVRYAKNP